MMSDREIGAFYWGYSNTSSFLYGTDLIREANGDVHFDNHLMPAGTAIHEWFSYTDYQSNRDIPMLPFLYDGKTYRVEADVDTEPANTFDLEVLFFDRFEQLKKRIVLYPPLYAFVYPEDSYYYTIRLINAGCDALDFRSLKLIEVADGS